MKQLICVLTIGLIISGFSATRSHGQTPVTDVGAGIQREALWIQEEGILSKINLYNVLIKALNGDIKGLTGEILGIDKEMLESLRKVSYLIKDYKRIQETKDILQNIIGIYTDKVPLLVQDGNFTTQQAAAIVESFDIILDDSKSLVTSILNTIIKDDLFMMDDKQRYDAINGIYMSVKRHYGTICYLHNKIMYASYMKSRNDNDLEGFAMYYSLYK